MVISPSAPDKPRVEPRVPSGHRPPSGPISGSTDSSRKRTTVGIPTLPSQASLDRQAQNQPSLKSLIQLDTGIHPTLDSLLGTEHDFTVSPEESPTVQSPIEPLATKNGPYVSTVIYPSQVVGHDARSRSDRISRSQNASGKQSATLDSGGSDFATPFKVASCPSPSITSARMKPKPKPSHLNTSLAPPLRPSPTRALSPGLNHWQQVRQHVMATSPADEELRDNLARAPLKKLGIVSRAAGKFGLRNAAENLMGYPDRRISSIGLSEVEGLSQQEKEEIARERRKFARNVKVCLDACALEESKRRAVRLSRAGEKSEVKNGVPSPHPSRHTAERFAFDPEYSAFAPLLTELHKHLPAARAKKLWSRTCPHHSAILAELRTAFSPDSTSTGGERQQALEVFGVVVKNWASDNADEELERWLWLCSAMLTDDQQLRNRGLTLLFSFFHADASLPKAADRPNSAVAFQRLAVAVVRLLQAIEETGPALQNHQQNINDFLAELCKGNIMKLDEVSVNEVTSAQEPSDKQGGIERELLWMAIGRSIGGDPHLATWLIGPSGGALHRFMPAPLLHATPPIVLQLRSMSVSLFLGSLSSILHRTTDAPYVADIWRIVETLFLSDVDILPDPDRELNRQLGVLLLEMELQVYRFDRADSKDHDPDLFHQSLLIKRCPPITKHRQVLIRLLSDTGVLEKGVLWASKHIIPHTAVDVSTRMIRACLQNDQLFSLGRECAEALINESYILQTARPFGLWLQFNHPQLFYKPLFALSASTQSANLSFNLRSIRQLSALVGDVRFWTFADPQMVAVILMGNAAPAPHKGKGKEGELLVVNVKLGRYACMLEFTDGLEACNEDAGSGDRLRKLIEGVEARLGPMLEAEVSLCLWTSLIVQEHVHALPDWYRTLLCRLFLVMRSKTRSLKKTIWQRIIVSWLSDMHIVRQPLNDLPLMTLSAVYDSLGLKLSPMTSHLTPKLTSPAPSDVPRVTTHQSDQSVTSLALEKACSALLVAMHVCLTRDDWFKMLPYLWSRISQSHIGPAITFLVMKSAEITPLPLREIIMSDLGCSQPVRRLQAIRKIAMLYGWRYQALAPLVITDRRGPVFQFPVVTLDFVATEIGSPIWVSAQDVQDAALRKFGNKLPLEVRQRLMELGWTGDDTLSAKSDWEQVPVSRLPSLQYQANFTSTVDRSPHTSPSKSLMRLPSNGSGTSITHKRRRAVIAPNLLSIVYEQGSLLSNEPDAEVRRTSEQLVRLVQRDDPNALIRAFTDNIKDQFQFALPKLNATVASALPAYAYVTVNALVGYLRNVLRNDPTFPLYATTLTTISRLVPNVSGMSLRDIRKNKAEHVLLPASIHDDDGGFRLHPPWQTNQYDVQTAQLLVLNEVLKANPREVYLFKKMTSNLLIQGSIHHLPFSRAWLLLITTLFSTVSRSYNDRAELRHFLTNAGAILRMHGSEDLLVATHAMRVFVLCAARFRRLFASMGFSTIMRPVYETYARGNLAVKDCIEYCARRFYRLHLDSFVYQTCAVIADTESDPSTVYELLASLSKGDQVSSGISSGIRGLNDKEELDALVQMISGPEITVVEVGTASAVRQASKLANLSSGNDKFPVENVVRLFVTVIAANPASQQSIGFLNMFAGILPYIKDAASQELLREGVQALGVIIAKGKAVDQATKFAFQLQVDDATPDWLGARQGYICLAESFARSGGQLGADATKRALEMVPDLLRRQAQAIGPTTASFLRELMGTRLSGPKPVAFLKDIAPLFRSFISVLDFSAILDCITAFIKRADYLLDTETTTVIIDAYLEPAIQNLAHAADRRMAFIVPIRASTVNLLAAAIFLQGNALGTLERSPPSAGLLASIVLPLCLLLDAPAGHDREGVLNAVWIRLLHYVMCAAKSNTSRARLPDDTPINAASAVISLQIIKIISLRGFDAISEVKGLWPYIAASLQRTVDHGDGDFLAGSIIMPGQAPRVVDWMMWSIYELLCLRGSPLMIDLRYSIKQALAAMHRDITRSNPSTPGGDPRKESTSPHLSSGRARMPSGRLPSLGSGQHSRTPSAASPSLNASLHARMASQESVSHSPGPSAHLSPLVSGHSRVPSASSISGYRPSFMDLSARRASRPVFDALPKSPGISYRFPSSAPIRSLAFGEKRGGAIIHLLGAPNHVLSATSGKIPVMAVRGSQSDQSSKAIREVTVSTPSLKMGARKAVRVCLMVFGYDVEPEEDEDVMRIWSVHDALQVISNQSRIFVEEEFTDVFIFSETRQPMADDTRSVSGHDSEKSDLSQGSEREEDMKHD